MVRVISVYHFSSQSINTITEDIICASLISSNHIILVKSNNTIEIHELPETSDAGFNKGASFSTVDDVKDVQYCSNGNYILTLESKFYNVEKAASNSSSSANSSPFSSLSHIGSPIPQPNVKEFNYVRIYANWDSLATKSDNINAPLRARIAGKVTPLPYSDVSSKNLEMIELPLHDDYVLEPSNIHCCQTTGNILISSKNILVIYEFKLCSNQKAQNYIDFNLVPIYIDVNFIPQTIAMSENFISVMNKLNLNTFKINENFDEHTVNSKQTSSRSRSYNASLDLESTLMLDDDDKSKTRMADVEKNLNFMQIYNKHSINDSSFFVNINNNEQNRGRNLLEDDSNDCGANELRPTIVNDMVTTVKPLITDRNDIISSKYTISNVLQMKLIPINIDGVLRTVNDSFNNLKVMSLYTNNLNAENAPADDNSRVLISKYYNKNLYGCAILVTTQQDGYLYQYNNFTGEIFCIGIYPFTSYVIDVVLDHSILHALTENGVESYTVRIGHKMYMDFQICERPICLVGLRPFLGVSKILSSKNNLILLANATNSTPITPNDKEVNTLAAKFMKFKQKHTAPAPTQCLKTWTIYNLQIPLVDTLYGDFLELASRNYDKNSQSYIHLIEEAHIILKNSIELAKFHKEDVDGVKIVKIVFEVEENRKKLFIDSCLQLADYYIVSPHKAEYCLAAAYYKMASLGISDIFNRVMQIDDENKSMDGLIYTMKQFFLSIRNINYDSTIEMDSIFSSIIDYVPTNSKLKFGDAFIELFRAHSPSDISVICLYSSNFREYMNEKVFEFLKDRKEQRDIEDSLCVILHLLKKDDVMTAKRILQQIKVDNLKMALLKYWGILFEFKPNDDKKYYQLLTFSDFTEIFLLSGKEMNISRMFVEILINLICDMGFICFENVLKLFMDHLTSFIGKDGSLLMQTILQTFLEKYFCHYYEIKMNTNPIQQTNNSISIVTSETSTTVTTENNNHLSPEMLTAGIFGNSSSSTSSGASFYSKNNNTSLNSDIQSFASKEGLKVLIRIYLSQLKIYTTKLVLLPRSNKDLPTNEKINEYFDKIMEKCLNPDSFADSFKDETILFMEERPNYLNLMPPFENNILENENIQLEHHILIVVLKLQSLLCSQELTQDIVDELTQFVTNQNKMNMIGGISFLSIVYKFQQTLELLLKNCPQCLLEYGKNNFKMDTEWTMLIKMIQNTIKGYDFNEANLTYILFYQRLLKEILNYIASTKPLDVVLKIFPEDDTKIDQDGTENFNDYIRLCVDKERSEKLKQMIVNTGHQLYDTMNKKKA